MIDEDGGEYFSVFDGHHPCPGHPDHEKFEKSMKEYWGKQDLELFYATSELFWVWLNSGTKDLGRDNELIFSSEEARRYQELISKGEDAE